MTDGAAPDPLGDALLAARLFSMDPIGLGGLWLRGNPPVRDRIVGQLTKAMERDWHRMPVGVDEDRLLGGIDIAATLSAGRSIRRKGMLEEVEGGILAVPLAERLDAARAGRIAQALDAQSFSLVLLDDGSDDEAPPSALSDRVAFPVSLDAIRSLDFQLEPVETDAREVRPTAKLRGELAKVANALGVSSARALSFAARAMCMYAQLEGRSRLSERDVEAAVRLVLAPRATRIPQSAEPPAPETEPKQSENKSDGIDLTEDLLVQAALAAIPRDLLERIAAGKTRRGKGAGSGRKKPSGLRGRPLAARPGMPGGKARLALIDTLRAAAPWQPLRQRQSGKPGLQLRKDDLRVRRFEERAGAVTIFAVDASGSSALARLAEAKGAVELMLADAYRQRAEVALLAFRGTEAELLLPPTRSLTRARRALADLPGGGGTPLAAGIEAARALATQVESRGRTPFLVLMTDGKANVPLAGSGGRAAAMEDGRNAAARWKGGGAPGVLIDISPRPGSAGAEIAAAAGLAYVPLPHADASAVRDRVEAARSR